MISLSQMSNAIVFNNGIYSHEQNFQLSDRFQKIYSVIRAWVAAII
jgi:hypothetical protein